MPSIIDKYLETSLLTRLRIIILLLLISLVAISIVDFLEPSANYRNLEEEPEDPINEFNNSLYALGEDKYELDFEIHHGEDLIVGIQNNKGPELTDKKVLINDPKVIQDTRYRNPGKKFTVIMEDPDINFTYFTMPRKTTSTKISETMLNNESVWKIVADAKSKLFKNKTYIMYLRKNGRPIKLKSISKNIDLSSSLAPKPTLIKLKEEMENETTVFKVKYRTRS